MKTCPNCNFQQEEGVFCAKCGTQLEATDQASEQTSQSAATVNSQEGSNDNVEKVKQGLRQYWNYFLTHLKNPTQALQKGENDFINGLVTLILFAIAASLSLYFYVTKALESSSPFGSTLANEISFFGTNIRLIVAVFVLLAISFFSAVIMAKAANDQTTLKSLLTQYGSLSVPFTALNILAIIFGLMGSGFLTMSALGISTTMFLYFIPALFVYDKASAIKPDGQKVYLSLATVLIISIVSAIASAMFFVTLLASMLDLLSQLT